MDFFELKVLNQRKKALIGVELRRIVSTQFTTLERCVCVCVCVCVCECECVYLVCVSGVCVMCVCV